MILKILFLIISLVYYWSKKIHSVEIHSCVRDYFYYYIFIHRNPKLKFVKLLIYTYGTTISKILWNICCPTIIIPNWMLSSVKQPPPVHCNIKQWVYINISIKNNYKIITCKIWQTSSCLKPNILLYFFG